MMGKVCCESLLRNNTLVKQKSGYEQERRGFWKTAKGWVSLYEIKTAASQGGYLSGISG